MFIKAIAQLGNVEAESAYYRLLKLQSRGIDDIVKWVKLTDDGKGFTTVLIHSSTPKSSELWLCGFFAGAAK